MQKSRPLNTAHEPHNKKMESEIVKLKQRINDIESEKSELYFKNQKLKSDYEMRIVILESEKEYLQQNVDRNKRQLSSSLNTSSQEEQILLDKVSKKNEEIQNLESSNLSLKKKLVEYEDEILSLKIHNSRATSVIQEPIPQKPFDKDVSVDSELAQSTNVNTLPKVVEKQSPIVIEKEKKEVLVVGTSIMRNLDPRFLSKDYFTTKLSAYTVEEAGKVISNSKAEPDVVIFHSLTNNLKSEDPSDCVKKLKDVVHSTILKWPLSHVMVSLETPRADDPDLNNKVHVINGLIRSTFYKMDSVSIVDHSNLAAQGQPIIRFLNANDKCHLSAQGTSVLASNIRASLDKHFDVKSNKSGGHQATGGRGRYPHGPRGGYFPQWGRYPGSQGGYFRKP